MHNVLSPRDLVPRPDNMDEIVPHIRKQNVGMTEGRENSISSHKHSSSGL